MKVNLCRSVRQTAHPVLGHLGLDLFDLEASSQVRNAFHIGSDLCAKHWIQHSNRCAHWWFSLCFASWLCVSSKGVFYISSITFLCWIWLHSFVFVSILGSNIRDDEVCSQTCKRSQHEQSSYEVHGEAALQMSCLAVAFELLWCCIVVPCGTCFWLPLNQQKHFAELSIACGWLANRIGGSGWYQ